MSTKRTYLAEDIQLFKKKALQWADNNFSVACYFDSNHYVDPYSAFDVLIAAGSKQTIKASAGGAFHQLQHFLDNNPDYWIPGFLAYDLKNELEDLSSSNFDGLGFPDLFFFVPEHLILIKGEEINVQSEFYERIIKEINKTLITDNVKPYFKGTIQQRIGRETYIKIVEQIKQHIYRGDIYELNLCQEFYAEKAEVNPVATFTALNYLSPTPFANFCKLDKQYIISATPERFLSKRGSKLIAQPIKGTAPRSSNVEEDKYIRQNLKNSLKEQTENVMIVDLVRNDLTRSAKPGTVRVENLFGVYRFPQVHQLISTVVCEANPDLSLTDIIKNIFPMGSMTGAPKIRAMQLIEQYEQTKRSVFSGAVGYFSPSGDFDFNVVIRTLLYNADTKYLSFQAGSAITTESEAEKEYEKRVFSFL